ncbi:hypothetical protein D3C80_1447160 [compost metagenome]
MAVFDIDQHIIIVDTIGQRIVLGDFRMHNLHWASNKQRIDRLSIIINPGRYLSGTCNHIRHISRCLAPNSSLRTGRDRAHIIGIEKHRCAHNRCTVQILNGSVYGVHLQPIGNRPQRRLSPYQAGKHPLPLDIDRAG